MGDAGSLPTELGELAQVSELRINNNQLNGPPTMYTCRLVKRVYHSPEMCAGPIPTEIGRLAAIQVLWLYENQLTGAPLTAHICRLVNE